MKYVDDYIKEIKNHPDEFNRDRKELVKYLEEEILSNDDYYFEEERIELFRRWTETFFFKLEPFQLFLVSFVFMRSRKTSRTVFSSFFWTFSRGGGKNGLISALASFLISELHGVPEYDITIVANSEKQARTSFRDVYNILLDNGLNASAGNPQPFKVYKSFIENVETRSRLEFATSNPNTKDGGREGAVIFDEVHRYESPMIVNVLTSGLGKTDDPRRFFISTNGYVREGYYDGLVSQAREIWKTHDNPQELFPFICVLDDPKEHEDPNMWQKAQPMFRAPMSAYSERLFRNVKKEFYSLQNDPSARQEFMIKRMNLPEMNLENDVASPEDVLATAEPIPFDLLEGEECIAGVDFGSVRDFTAVGLLFAVEGKTYWVTHSFARKEYLDKAKLKPPIKEWAEKGLLTIVDDTTLKPTLVGDWLEEMSEKYRIRKVEIDSYKADLLKPEIESRGLEVEIIRKPSSIHPRLAPLVENGFANHEFIWGDNPLMRWYTNNVFVKTLKDGGKQYLKKDEHRRKTDGFQAFLHALSRRDELIGLDLKAETDNILGFYQ